jgi:glycerophosphoryl diester phosphodiesterase
MVTRRLAAAAALLLAACDRFHQVDGSPLPELARPIVVMHRGAGQGNADYRENTLRAMLYGAPLYDGVEMDLQLSADGTLWLGHDNDVYDCAVPGGESFYEARSGRVAGCFQELTDAQIAQYAWCDSATAQPCASPTDPTCVERYVTLEEIFDRFSTDASLLAKYLALDVKDQLCGASLGVAESRDMARALHQLVRAYRMDWRLFVESDMATFMDEFHALGTPEYLFVEGYGPVDPIIADADRNHATGISYRYTEAPLDPAFPPGLRGAGLRVMMWPVPENVNGVFTTSDIPLVWAMRPDVIATDVPDFYSYVLLPQPF